MRIILSPAKKMNADTDGLAWRELPQFLDRTEQLLDILQAMSEAELKKLWKCNDALVKLNRERLRKMDLRRNLTPAILSYEGIQYRCMAPSVFTTREFEYIQEHLRILSGFYGLLRPFDGVTPYRLEMQAKLATGGEKNLYAFWKDAMAQQLFAETDCIINLASKEYSACVSKYRTSATRMVTCIFGEKQDGKILEKGTLCKMARGEMVRYMAEHAVSRPEELLAFDRMQFRYSPEYSNLDTLVFLRQGKAGVRL